MKMDRLSNAPKLVKYIFTKLTGAGFLFFMMAIYTLLLNGFELYDFSNTFREGLLWFVVFIYGIFSSVVIDLIAFKIKASLWLRITFYIIAGYAIFLFFGFSIFTIIAGTVGAIAALVFFYGTTLPKKSASIGLIIAFVIPAALFTLSLFDFTEKQGWTEQRREDKFSVSFDYFNGEHAIPVELKKGEAIDITRVFDDKNKGGQGFHVKNKENELVGMAERPNGVLRLNASYDGIYNLVIKGSNLEGKITISWEYVN